MDITKQPLTCLECKNRETDAEIALICNSGCCASSCFAIL